MPTTFQAFPSWAPGPPLLATSAPVLLSPGSPVSLIPVPVAAVGPVAPAPLTTVAQPLPAGPSLILSTHSAHAAHPIPQMSQSMSSSPVASPMSPTVTSFGLSAPKAAPAPGLSAPHAQNDTFLSASRSPFTFGCTEEAGSVVDLSEPKSKHMSIAVNCEHQVTRFCSSCDAVANSLQVLIISRMRVLAV